MIYLQVGTDNFATTIPTPTGTTWACLTVVRQGGVIYTYQDGLLYDTRSNSETVGDIDHILRLGTGIPYRVSPANGSLALWRIGATAPTAEQIKKMYEDERKLFYPGAQATLEGTSDNVVAIDYDNAKKQLRAGTSGGTSVFEGLRRVESTTNAVTAALSVQNGLAAEE